jgi:predicted Fe-S protein YdhL (DUF1289 family)
MKTPCKKICKVEKGICIGCMRTLSEIKRWSRMDDEERGKIIKETKSRRNIK